LKHKSSGNDLATYLRLLRYLRGFGSMSLLLFIAIVAEALFTVGTISTLAPILDLVQNTSLVDRTRGSEDRGEVGQRKYFADGTVAVRIAGNFEEAGRVRDATRTLLDSGGSNLLIDATGAHNLGGPAWAELFRTKLALDETTATMTVVHPPALRPPQELLGAKNLRFVDATTSNAAELNQQYLSTVPLVTGAKVATPQERSGFRKRLSEMARPYLVRLQQFADQSPDNRGRVLRWLVGALVLSAIMTAVCGFAVGYLSSYMSAAAVQRLRDHVFSHQLGLDLSYFTRNSQGKLMSVVTNDVKAVEGSIDLLFSNVIKTPVTVIVLVSGMLFISVELTLFTFIIVPVLSGLLYVVGRRIRKVSGRVQRASAVLSSILEEATTGIRVVKAFTMEQREAERFKKENRSIFRMTRKSKAVEELGTMLTQIFGILMVASILLLGSHFMLKQDLRSSEFVLFVGFLFRLFQPLKGMSRVTTRLQRGLAGADRVFTVLDTQPEITDRPNAVPAQRLTDAIEFRNVHFRYSADRALALDSINLRLPAGKAIALVGETGSGKSTLVNMLPRFYDPTEGDILYDGKNLRDLTIKSLRQQIAIITQDVVLFDDTIANNIAYGVEGPPDMNRVVAAAEAANAHGFITAKLPQGYETPVGTRGSRLSGGERQRIAIARAIYRNVPILILDEATSALDSETESLIQDALNHVMEGRTVVVVAHRLSTIQNCDEIYVMDHGRFVENGTHEELLRQNGRYARFHAIQFGTAQDSNRPEPPIA